MDVGVFVELEPVGVADTQVGTFVAVYFLISITHQTLPLRDCLDLQV